MNPSPVRPSRLLPSVRNARREQKYDLIIKAYIIDVFKNVYPRWGYFFELKSALVS
jgi:hypothetical protein